MQNLLTLKNQAILKNKIVSDTLSDDFFTKIYDTVVSSENYHFLTENNHHNKISVAEHTLFVACSVYQYARKKNLKLDYASLVRGSLLHDYYFYDWHDKNKGFRGHGYKHNDIALKNAEKDFDLNKKEKNMIISHMFPLTFWRLPKFKESWLLIFFDKITAIKEYMGKFIVE